MFIWQQKLFWAKIFSSSLACYIITLSFPFSLPCKTHIFLTRKIHGIVKRLSTANKFVYFENTQIWGISKSGFPAFTPLSIADSYNSLRFYMNNAGKRMNS